MPLCFLIAILIQNVPPISSSAPGSRQIAPDCDEVTATRPLHFEQVVGEMSMLTTHLFLSRSAHSSHHT